jgi:hypothetical protein
VNAGLHGGEPSPGRPIEAPGTQPVSFDVNIRPLFREFDRDEMLYTFDLWEATSVAKEAREILERLEEGTMPCDAPWDATDVDLFKRWMELGCPP